MGLLDAAGEVLGAVGGVLGAASGSTGFSFGADPVPTYSPLATRSAQLPDFRPAVLTRNQMLWLVPEGTVVGMYINPQSIRHNHGNKGITKEKTKGGYSLQYWMPDLGVLQISGTTGTSGYEGINVLADIYRNEQLAFDPYALTIAAKLDKETYSAGAFGGGPVEDFVNNLAAGGDVLSSALGAAAGVSPSTSNKAPSLAYLAFTVELYWCGEVFRGFFTDFNVQESADKLGFFDYDITFEYTQKRGLRQNFLAWHRSPTAGMSNSDPQLGTPYSFGQLVEGTATPPGVENTNGNPFSGAFSGITGQLNDLANTGSDIQDVGEDFYKSFG